MYMYFTEKNLKIRDIFSSPKHEVIRVSYCDRAVSIHRQLFALCMLMGVTSLVR